MTSTSGWSPRCHRQPAFFHLDVLTGPPELVFAEHWDRGEEVLMAGVHDQGRSGIHQHAACASSALGEHGSDAHRGRRSRPTRLP